MDTESTNAMYRLTTPALLVPDNWSSVYTFGNESILAAGTRIVINSGDPNHASPPLPRIVQRFRESPGQTGQVQLNSNAVDLRLVDSGNNVVHARRFLAPTSFSSIQCKLLRKPDRTAFVLIPAASAAFPAGTYRMTLTFLRDNTAADPNSLILSAAGQKDPEVATIDIPWTPATEAAGVWTDA